MPTKIPERIHDLVLVLVPEVDLLLPEPELVELGVVVAVAAAAAGEALLRAGSQRWTISHRSNWKLWTVTHRVTDDTQQK